MSNEDYIDFPCSDLWLGYYHDKGLTPRNPQEDYLMKKIERLERQNKQLFYLVAERLQKESKEIKRRREICLGCEYNSNNISRSY